MSPNTTVKGPRDKGAVDLDKQGKNIVRCAGQSYFIPLPTCEARQGNAILTDYYGCARCTYRKGGKNCPTGKENHEN